MSKLYEHYKICKLETPDKIILIKSGTFYVILAEDANLVNQILGLKLTPLNEQIQKCGFPINSLPKYENLLKAHSIDYITTSMNEAAKDPTQVEKKIINEIKLLNLNETSPLNAFHLISKYQEQLRSSNKE